jgi:hypothetical protein
MKAVCLHEQGGIEKLVLDENFPDPKAGDGQVVSISREKSPKLAAACKAGKPVTAFW